MNIPDTDDFAIVDDQRLITISPITLGRYIAKHLPDTTPVVMSTGLTPSLSTVILQNHGYHRGPQVYEIELHHLPGPMPYGRAPLDTLASAMSQTETAVESRQSPYTVMWECPFPDHPAANNAATWDQLATTIESAAIAQYQTDPEAVCIVRNIIRVLPFYQLASMPNFGGVAVVYYACTNDHHTATPQVAHLAVPASTTTDDHTSPSASYVISVRALGAQQRHVHTTLPDKHRSSTTGAAPAKHRRRRRRQPTGDVASTASNWRSP